ncbi:MAG: hypothetical protein H7Z15_17590 [Rhizobacter sp.]|nr:hypothetical protein [Rhizobacter sp.]
MTPSTLRHALRCATVVAVALLSACGGSSESDTPQMPVGSQTAQSVSANTLVLGPDTVNANAAVLRTAQAVVASASGQVTATVACGGGGTARFTASGGSGLSLLNGVLDAGERYSILFDNCRASAGAESLSGLMSIDVISASANELTLQTSTQGIVVTRPQRTFTLNGSSTISQSTVTNGTTVTTTNRWVSPQIALTSLHNANLSSLSFSNVDLTTTSTTVNGVLTGSTSSGALTITVAWPGNSWSATIATQGPASYDANGVATQGSWLMTLPHDRIGLVVAAGLATVTLDNGANGSIDHTFFFGVLALMVAAA